jgi:hypothetical protein
MAEQYRWYASVLALPLRVIRHAPQLARFERVPQKSPAHLV